MKKSQPAPPQVSCASAEPVEQPKQQQRRLQSTAAILARGVSLDQVQKAVEKLRPQVHQVG